jgi:glyoxylase-like metal-dependent hydrolase (beta-lactamase superfamily II)
LAEPAYEVTAIRYGSLRAPRSELFQGLGEGGEPAEEVEMAYYFWLLRSPQRTVLVDTGFDPAVAARRGRVCEVEPLAALAAHGVAPEQVDAVVITHFHYDHVGNVGAFPAAELIVSRRELEFWTGAEAREPRFAAHVEPAEVEAIAAAVTGERGRTTSGEEEILPGVRSIEVGGHSPGQLVLVVSTGSGSAVLASDAVHFYEELERRRPFAIQADLGATEAAYRRIEALAREPGTVVFAGHDPLVMQRFPGGRYGPD